MLNLALKIGIQIAMAAASMAITASQKFEGQRLTDTSVNLADYGAPLPRFWGVSRFDACPVIFAEKLKEKKVTHKTKGGKYVEYKYYGTWAVAIADHEIDAIRAIWLDRHLCYQARGVGPLTPVLGGLSSILGGDTDGPPVKLAQGRNMRIYLGTEDQEPDPRYEAWCEDRYGEPDMAPAFKGTAYLVLIDIPLEKFGNHLAQLSIEASNNKADEFPYEIRGDGGSGVDGIFSPDGTIMYQEDSSNLFVWDVATRSLINKRTNGPFGSISAAPGALYALGGGFVPASKQLWQFNADGSGGTNLTPFGFSIYTGGLRYVAGSVLFYPVTTNESYYGIFVGGTDGVIAVDIGYAATHFFEGPDSSAWACGVDSITESNLHVSRLMPNLFAPAASHTTGGGAAYGMWNGEGGIVVWQDGQLYLLDAEDPSTILAGPVAHGVSVVYADLAFRAVLPGAARIWIGFSEIDTRTLQILRTVDPSDWIAQTMTGGCYDAINHALITHAFGTDEITWRYLDRVGSDGVALSVVVSDVMGWAGVTNFDAIALDQLVKGYSVTPGSGRDMIDPLLTAHFSSARPHDFSLQFIKLGDAPTGDVIPTDDFASIGGAPRFAGQIVPDKQLPRKITVNFADVDKDYQTNNTISQRGLDEVSSVSDQTIDLSTYSGTPDEIRPLGDRYFRQKWLERETVTCSVTPQEMRIEPGDVRQIALDGKVRTVRAEKITFTAGALRIEWKRTHPSLAALSTNPGAPMAGRDPDEIYVAGPTKGIAVDIPLADDAHDSTLPQVYYGAGKYLASAAWPGAAFYKGDATGENYTDIAEVSSASGMTWGYASGVLASADPWVWDRGNSVNIDVRGGTLSSVTEADIAADPTINLAYLGGELINFTTATLEADGTYTLSGLRRGRRGTEWAVDGHSTNEEFVLVSSLARLGLGLSEVGVREYFKAATQGQDVEGAQEISFVFTAATLKPYAPARIKATFNGSDWTFTLVTRTRLGGAWTGGSTIPLGEDSEEYEIDVLDGSGDVVRILSLSGTKSITYTAAQQTTDFGSIQTSMPDLNAYQVSASVGRGFALAA